MVLLFQSALGLGFIVFLAGMFLVTEFLVKARGLAALAAIGLLVLYAFVQNPELNGWMIGLLVVGLILLILDGQLVQDGTLAGVGILVMLIGLVVPTGDWIVGSVVGLMWIFGILSGFLSLKVLPRRDVWDQVILKNALTRETGYSSINDKYRDLVGKEAEAVSDMRPTGTIEIDGKIYSAVSQGVWVKKGTRLRVVSVDGTRILIDPVSEPPSS
ncbi:hypothetical protein CHM34_05730 [Paludifilum halophilum]|uniref:NfeD-like C-terminal domain-containing protein n=2 Tax=Paludifilum halophilum TaxID=1642702 RepID=A0A235B8P4_9BACL|nr:hypothetical protein CHM34_05730 [Paludifilum halophilum]